MNAKKYVMLAVFGLIFAFLSPFALSAEGINLSDSSLSSIEIDEKINLSENVSKSWTVVGDFTGSWNLTGFDLVDSAYDSYFSLGFDNSTNPKEITIENGYLGNFPELKVNLTYENSTGVFHKVLDLIRTDFDSKPVIYSDLVDNYKELETGEDEVLIYEFNVSDDWKSFDPSKHLFWDDDGLNLGDLKIKSHDGSSVPVKVEMEVYNKTKGEFIFTPDKNKNGDFNFSVVLNHDISIPFNFIINPVNDVPELKTSKTHFVAYNRSVPFQHTFIIDDVDSESFSYDLETLNDIIVDDVSFSDNQLTLDLSYSRLSGYLDENSFVLDLVLTVTDGDGASDSLSFSVEFVDKPKSDYDVNGNFTNISSVTDFEIESEGLSIAWSGPIDLSSYPDLSEVVYLDESSSESEYVDYLLYVNGSSSLKTEAMINITGLNDRVEPRIGCSNGKVLNRSQLKNNCTTVQNKIFKTATSSGNGYLSFMVPHFSSYRIVSDEIFNSDPYLDIDTSTITITQDDIGGSDDGYDLPLEDDDGDVVTVIDSDLPDDVEITEYGRLYNLDSLDPGFYNVEIEITDGFVTVIEEFSLKLVPESELKVVDFEFRTTEDDDWTDFDDGEDLDDEEDLGAVYPSDLVEFRIELENEYSDNEDLDIEGEIEIILFDIDDGDDIEITRSFDIKADSDIDVDDLELVMPSRFYNDGEFDGRVTIRSENEDGDEFEDIVYDFTVDARVKNHHVILENFYLSPSEVSCSYEFELVAKVTNVGSRDEDVVLKITNSELGIQTTEEFELEDFESDDESYTFRKTYTAENVDFGEYTIRALVYFDDEDEVTGDTVTLTKSECPFDNGDDSTDDSSDDSYEDSTGGVDSGDLDNFKPLEPTIEDKPDSSNEVVLDPVLMLSTIVIVLLVVLLVILLVVPKKK